MQRKYTATALLLYAFYAVFFGLITVLATNSSPNNTAYQWELPAVLIGFPLVAVGIGLYQRRQYNQRTKSITHIMSEHNWTPFSSATKGNDPNFGLSSLLKVGDNKITHQRNCIYTEEWAYCDYSYDVYRETKYGEYKESEMLYALMGTTLPRKLPNVVFDSLKSRRRQFKPVYDKSQKHSLEGNFDSHFVTYFPEGYTIDSLSFITPDVMIALQEADAYDVEIIDDNLFIFGPMKDASVQLPEMSAKLLSIKKELLDNILTYRDERLPYAMGRQEVSLAGARLKSAKKNWLIPAILCILYIIFRVWVESS
jgi:hypothetical protein